MTIDEAPPIPEVYELENIDQQAALARLIAGDSAYAESGSDPVAPTPKQRKPLKDCTYDEVLARYPRICAHLICETLGYFSARSAAGCLRAVAAGQPYWCELHMHKTTGHVKAMDYKKEPVPRDENGYLTRKFYESTMLAMTRDTLQRAVELRSHHHGMMADYREARMIVAYQLTPQGKQDLLSDLMAW